MKRFDILIEILWVFSWGVIMKKIKRFLFIFIGLLLWPFIFLNSTIKPILKHNKVVKYLLRFFIFLFNKFKLIFKKTIIILKNSKYLFGPYLIYTFVRLSKIYKKNPFSWSYISEIIGIISVFLLFLIGNLIWKLKLSKFKKYVLLLFSLLAFAGIFYVSVKKVAGFHFNKHIQSIYRKENLKELNRLYSEQKKLNIEEEVDTIRNILNDDALDMSDLVKGLERINIIINNPFFDKNNGKEIIRLRNIISDFLKKYAKETDNDEFLRALITVEAYSELISIIGYSPIGIKAYKIYLEKGITGYKEFLEKLLLKKSGQDSFRRMCASYEHAISLLELVLNNDVNNFKEVSLSFLFKFSEHFKLNSFLNDYINLYKNNLLPDLLGSYDGHKKIIQDIKGWNKILIIYFDKLFEIINKKNMDKFNFSMKNIELEMNNDSNFKNKIENIIKEIGINHE
jgi:predicted MPP superfamily phosphohydrolase